jgi:sucrose-6-phosphate hydrolase SacC (GH32 family)
VIESYHALSWKETIMKTSTRILIAVLSQWHYDIMPVQRKHVANVLRVLRKEHHDLNAIIMREAASGVLMPAGV